MMSKLEEKKDQIKIREQQYKSMRSLCAINGMPKNCLDENETICGRDMVSLLSRFKKWRTLHGN